MGYTTIQSTYRDVTAQVRYFVPRGANLEVLQVKVTNNRATPADLSLFSFVEFCLWDAYDDMTNFQRNFSIGEVEIEDGVIYHKTEYRERRDHFAYFACSEPLAGFDTSRDEFLGVYHGFATPDVVVAGRVAQLGRARLGTGRIASRQAGARTGRKPRDQLRARLSGKPARR